MGAWSVDEGGCLLDLNRLNEWVKCNGLKTGDVGTTFWLWDPGSIDLSKAWEFSEVRSRLLGHVTILVKHNLVYKDTYFLSLGAGLEH